MGQASACLFIVRTALPSLRAEPGDFLNLHPDGHATIGRDIRADRLPPAVLAGTDPRVSGGALLRAVVEPIPEIGAEAGDFLNFAANGEAALLLSDHPAGTLTIADLSATAEWVGGRRPGA
jgi:hypothetical protein